MHPRIEIVRRIDDIKDQHCATCEDILKVNNSARNTYCKENCDLGKELITLGDQLTELTNQKRANKPKSNWSDLKPLLQKKPKEKLIIQTLQDKRSEPTVELTKEKYLELKEQKLTDTQIISKFHLNNAKFYKIKKDWGLKGVKNSMSDLPEKETDTNDEVKTVADPSPVEEKQNNSVVEFNNELATINKDLIQQIQDLLANNKELNAELVKNKTSHEEVTKELVQEVISLRKYKELYLTTVEALKVHLP